MTPESEALSLMCKSSRPDAWGNDYYVAVEVLSKLTERAETFDAELAAVRGDSKTNAALLARQTDLAREAETKLAAVTRGREAFRKALERIERMEPILPGLRPEFYKHAAEIARRALIAAPVKFPRCSDG